MPSRALAAALILSTTLLGGVAGDVVVITEYASACSAVYTSGSRSLTVVQSTITTGSPLWSDELTNGGTSFMLQIASSGPSAPREKRESEGFYLLDTGEITADPSEASHFRINSNGQLSSSNGQVVSTNGNVRDMTLAASRDVAAISTKFVTRNLTLVWENASFDQGMAEFYSHSGQNGDMALVHFSGPVPATWRRISMKAVPALHTGSYSSASPSHYSVISTIISSDGTTIHLSTRLSSAMLPTMGSMSTGRPSPSESRRPSSFPPQLTSLGRPLSSPSPSSESPVDGQLKSTSSTTSNPSPSASSKPTSSLSASGPSSGKSSTLASGRSSTITVTASSSNIQSSTWSLSVTSAQTISTSSTRTSASSRSPVSSTPAGLSSSARTSLDTSVTTSSAGAYATGGTSEDGLCGSEWEGAFSCMDSLFGDCCSSDGFCGTGDEYCGSGCQAGFGRCDDVATTGDLSQSLPDSSSSLVSRSWSSISLSAMVTSTSSSLPPFASSGGPIYPSNPSVAAISSSSPRTSVSAANSAVSSTSSLPTCSPAACADTTSSSTTCDSPYGNPYVLSCGSRNTGTVIQDTSKRDLKSRALTRDVNECLTLCDTTPGCVAINYNDGLCTRFSSVTGKEPAPGSLSGSRAPGVTTTRTTPPSISATATSSKSSSTASSSSLASTTSSRGAPSPPSSTLSTSSASSPPSTRASNGSTRTSAATEPAVGTSSATSSNLPSGTTCPGIDGGRIPDGHGNAFIIGCGDDTSGNAFTRRMASNSWRDCLDACNDVVSSGDTCTGFTYVGGYEGEGAGFCALKNEEGLTFEYDQGVIFVGAIKITSNRTGAGLSSSTPSSTTSPYLPSSLSLTSTKSSSGISSSSSLLSSSSSSTSQRFSSTAFASTSSSPASSSRSVLASSSASSSPYTLTTATVSSSLASSTISSTRTNAYILSSPTPCNFGDNYVQDDSYCRIDLPFTVRLYHEMNRTVYASSNGFLTIGSGSASHAPQSLPTDETNEIPPNAAFPYWMDLCVYADKSPRQAILYQVGSSGTNVTFEYYVGIGGHEADGIVHFTVGYDNAHPGIWTYHYYSLGVPGGETANGKYASVGIQGLDANGREAFNQYSYRSADIAPGLVVVCDTNVNTCITQS